MNKNMRNKLDVRGEHDYSKALSWEGMLSVVDPDGLEMPLAGGVVAKLHIDEGCWVGFFKDGKACGCPEGEDEDLLLEVFDNDARGVGIGGEYFQEVD